MTLPLARVRTASLSVTVALLASCASSPREAMPARPATQTIGAPGSATGSITIATPTVGPDVATLPYPLDRVWTALPIVLDSLKVPLAKVDPAGRVIGNESFKIRQRLGKTALSRYFDCGSTQIGPNADSYDLLLTVIAQLEPAGATATKISTTVQAMAKPITFNQEYAACSSRGELESKLLGLLRAELQR
jgi:hypothetical protein